MSRYQIVCTDQPNCHIVSVGVGTDPDAANEKMTVQEVWRKLDAGHFFYTSDSYGNVAAVRKYDCPCGRGSLRSAPDATKANNLDNLRLCRWKAA